MAKLSQFASISKALLNIHLALIDDTIDITKDVELLQQYAFNLDEEVTYAISRVKYVDAVARGLVKMRIEETCYLLKQHEALTTYESIIKANIRFIIDKIDVFEPITSFDEIPNFSMIGSVDLLVILPMDLTSLTQGDIFTICKQQKSSLYKVITKNMFDIHAVLEPGHMDSLYSNARIRLSFMRRKCGIARIICTDACTNAVVFSFDF